MNEKPVIFGQFRILFSSTIILQILVLASSHLFISCRHGSVYDSTAELSFAIGDIEHSLLKDIMKTDGRLSVCLGLIGFDEINRNRARQFYTESAIKAANDWNSLLLENPEWPVKHRLTLNFEVKEDQCAAKPMGFGINVWSNASDFERDYCARVPICTSATDVINRLITIGPVNRGKSVGIFNYFTVVHEYGHLLALGDTYRNPGMSDWDDDQPPSVMNGGNFPREAFTEDDRWGIWAVFWSLISGSKDCHNYGRAVSMRLNAWNTLLCDPRTIATYQHRSLINLPELPNPDPVDINSMPVRNGLWSYRGFDINETAILIDEVRVSDVRVSFRSYGVNNGTVSSRRGSICNCQKPGNSDLLRCSAARDPRYRLSFTSPVSGTLFTPDYEAGVKIKNCSTCLHLK